MKTAAFQVLTDLIPARAMTTNGERSQIRRLWWHVFELLRPTGLLRVPVGNYRMWVNTADTIISWCLTKHGSFEIQESEILRAVLKPGDSFVDCGANIGYYTLLGAAAIGPSGHVCAFEPVPDNYALLAKNIEDNGLGAIVTAYAVALGNVVGEVDITLDRGNFGAHSLHAANVLEPQGVVTVPVRRLDDLLGQRRVDVIKIDTQGAESEILAGAAHILSRDRPILFLEWWPWGLRTGGGASALADFLQSLGYQAGIICGESRTRVKLQGWKAIIDNYSPADPDTIPTLVCAARALNEILPQSMLVDVEPA